MAVVAGPWLPWQPADAGTSPASSTAPPGATGCGVSSSVRSPLGLLAQWWSLLARLLGWGAGVSAGVVDNSRCHPGLLCGWQWAEKGCCNNVLQTKALTRQLRIFLCSGGGTPGPGAGRAGSSQGSSPRRAGGRLLPVSSRGLHAGTSLVSPLFSQGHRFCCLRVHSYDLI